MQAPTLRARTPGEILDAAFQLLRSHFSAIVLASSAFLLPPLLLQWMVPAAAALANVLNNLLTLAAAAVVAVVVSDIYTGSDVDLRGSIRKVGSRFLSVWGAAIIQGILLFAGFLCLVVGVFWVMAWTFAMPAVVMLEGASASDSFTRSRELSKGYIRHILATVGVAWIIFWAAVIGVSVLGGVGAALLNVGDAVVEPLVSLAILVLYPFVGVVTTLLYFDLRIRKEALDLQLLAQAIPDVAPPVPAGV